jgi:hypothetical protein
MWNSKTFMIAVITAGALAAPTANASESSPLSMSPPPKPPKPPPKPPKPPKCDKIKIEKVEVTDLGLNLKVKGNLECLKNRSDVKLEVQAFGDGKARCKNPGGNFPPGQNPKDAGEVVATGKIWIDSSKIWNGKTSFTVIAEPDDLEIDGAPHCPNAKWKEILADVSYDTAFITVHQDGKTRTFECSFDPTKNNKTQTATCD